MGLCEKICNAINHSCCSKNSSNSTPPESPMPATTTQAASLPTPIPSVKAFDPQTKPAAVEQSWSVLPITVDPPTFLPTPNEKEKKIKPKVSPKIEPGSHPGSVEEDQTKPKAVDMIKLARNIEVASTPVSVLEKPKLKEGILKGTNATLKVEPAKPHASVQEEKPKPKLEILGRVNTNNKFSAYIERAKIKIRATSNVGGGKGASGLDSFNERVSDYIERSKAKLRITSNVGGGKNASGPDNIDEKVSDYIDRVKVKHRTTSNVGGGKSSSFKTTSNAGGGKSASSK